VETAHTSAVPCFSGRAASPPAVRTLSRLPTIPTSQRGLTPRSSSNVNATGLPGLSHISRGTAGREFRSLGMALCWRQLGDGNTVQFGNGLSASCWAERTGHMDTRRETGGLSR
jgi:hypothetical protein